MLEYVRYADARHRRPDGTPTGHLENIKTALRPLKTLYADTQANDFACVMLRARYLMPVAVSSVALNVMAADTPQIAPNEPADIKEAR